jgi:hypothetical protein
MPIAQSGQTKALVGSRVFVVADAKEGEFEKLDDRREHSLARQAVPPQIGFHPRSDQRQNPRKHQHLTVFCFVPHLAPSGVVAILLASSLIAPSNLDMS